MGILELPDQEFLRAYLKIVEIRFPKRAERRRYENIQKHRPRISKEEHEHIMARLAVYDKKVRIKKKKHQRLGGEDNKVDWKQIDEKVFETKRDFQVLLLVDGEEVKWPVTAFTMKGAQDMALQAAYENGASFVMLIR